MGKNTIPTTALDVYDFGRELVRTNDLDPVYVCVHCGELEPPLLKKWLLAYWCFYHMGTASWITSQPNFWDAMRRAAGSKEYPRGTERRHFRGKQAAASVEFLADQDVDGLWEDLGRAGYEGRTLQAENVTELVQEWRGFGPWIAFKVADMIERLGLVKVKFDAAAVLLFDSPRQGAELLWRTEQGTEPPENGAGEWAIARILEEIGTLKAPPRYERTLNAQEAETVLCKWKSAMGGHYQLGEDLHSVCRSLLRYPRCKTAQRLLRGGRKGGLWWPL